jgi:hypothetical protein
VQRESEARRFDRLEDEELHASIESQGEGCLVRTRVCMLTALKSWKLFTYSFSTWLFGVAKGIVLVAYRVFARIADILGIKGALFLSSIEAFLEGHLDGHLERRRFLAMDGRHKRILLKMNQLDHDDPHRRLAVDFSDASPPALVHSLIKSISVMEHAKALVGLGDAEREALMDRFFLQVNRFNRTFVC